MQTVRRCLDEQLAASLNAVHDLLKPGIGHLRKGRPLLVSCSGTITRPKGPLGSRELDHSQLLATSPFYTIAEPRSGAEKAGNRRLLAHALLYPARSLLLRVNKPHEEQRQRKD